LDKLLNDIAKQLFDEKISKGFINNDLYNKTADMLIKAVHEGMGGTRFAYDDERNILKAYLERNIYKFSAAKTLAEMEEFKKLMLNPDGTITDFVTFRNKVTAAGFTFNQTYLKTEYDTAYQSALMACKWDTLSATCDYLEYSTAKDNRVRPQHAVLDGLTLPVNSPVWNNIWPPIDWNCRCTIVPGTKHNATLTDGEASKLGKFIKPYFKNNSGKTKTIYKDDHPYFIDANLKENSLKAVKNYGLKSIEQILADTTKLPEIEELKSIDEYQKWWLNKFGTEPAIITDIMNNNILFDTRFKNHLLEKVADKRHVYASNFINTIQQPSEVWSGLKNGKLTNFYIKYFKTDAFVAVINDQESNLKGLSFYKLTPVRLNELRQGILIYSK